MLRVLLAAIAVACFALLAPSADARTLTKHDARAGSVRFMTQIVWAFDRAQTGEKFHVRPAPRCVRISHVTVTCPVTVRLPTSRAKIRGYLRVHRTRQGILGYLLPWDPAAVADALGQPAGAERVPYTVEVGLE